MTIWREAGPAASAGTRRKRQLGRTGAGVDSEGGLRRAARVKDGVEEFPRLVGAVLARFFAQNARAPLPAAESAALGARLWTLVTERGLPRPLGPEEIGVPGGMSEDECAPLVARVLGGSDDPLLAKAARQLVKACFYPEFKVCRDSFREVAADGGCRRQELKRVLERVSGTHCVDCPHWVALDAVAHKSFLAVEWKTGAAEFARHRDVFLPEDFRALRVWLHARARTTGMSPMR